MTKAEDEKEFYNEEWKESLFVIFRFKMKVRKLYIGTMASFYVKWDERNDKKTLRNTFVIVFLRSLE